jgi:hypothetical protein
MEQTEAQQPPARLQSKKYFVPNAMGMAKQFIPLSFHLIKIIPP